VKEAKARTDCTASDGEEETWIFISDGDFDWMYYPDENTAVKLDAGSGINPGKIYEVLFTGYYYGAIAEGEMLVAMEAACALDPECASVSITGHETVAGESCIKFTWTGTDGSTSSLWISTSTGWLIKTADYDAPTGITTTMEFTNIDLDPTISDDIFDVHQVFVPWPEITDMTSAAQAKHAEFLKVQTAVIEMMTEATIAGLDPTLEEETVGSGYAIGSATTYDDDMSKVKVAADNSYVLTDYLTGLSGNKTAYKYSITTDGTVTQEP
jgi:outer membrane lipoprotein-sorting protein